MTRRDYCENCSKLVSDFDVMCDICSNSYCHDCAIPHDVISHIILMSVKVLVMSESTMSVNLLHEFYTKLYVHSHDIISKFHPGLNANNYYTDYYNTTMEMLKNINNKYFNNQDIIESDDIKIIAETIYDIYTIMHDNDICYVCSSCNKC